MAEEVEEEAAASEVAAEVVVDEAVSIDTEDLEAAAVEVDLEEEILTGDVTPSPGMVTEAVVAAAALQGVDEGEAVDSTVIDSGPDRPTQDHQGVGIKLFH